MNNVIVPQQMSEDTTTRAAHTWQVFVVPAAPAPSVPAKQPYWQGYDMYIECAFSGDWLTDEEFAAMTPEERRGYEAAARHQADNDTYAYLSNRNSFGDLTEY